MVWKCDTQSHCFLGTRSHSRHILLHFSRLISYGFRAPKTSALLPFLSRSWPRKGNSKLQHHLGSQWITYLAALWLCDTLSRKKLKKNFSAENLNSKPNEQRTSREKLLKSCTKETENWFSSRDRPFCWWQHMYIWDTLHTPPTKTPNKLCACNWWNHCPERLRVPTTPLSSYHCE